jgi:hypothetical protein
MLIDSPAFVLVVLAIYLVQAAVLGVAAGGLTRWILGRPWSRKAAIGDAVLACVVTYTAMQVEVSLTPFQMAHGILYWGQWVEYSFGLASVVAWQLVQQIRSGRLRTAIMLKVVGGVLLLVLMLVGVGIWYGDWYILEASYHH